MKIILDNSEQEHRVWTLHKTSANPKVAVIEVGTGGHGAIYLHICSENTTEIVSCKETACGGAEVEMLFLDEESPERIAELLSFAGAALKELTRASAALEEHLK